ncbi:MAG: four helix bundle protein [Saprospiraceae bacterium]|nr:four helix bundle protein [Saprospiraceae bacterium]
MEEKRYIPLEDLDIYQLAMDVGELVWNNVAEWNSFVKFHSGGQFADAADSTAANIAEGYGRFHYKDKRNFYLYGPGLAQRNKNMGIKSLPAQFAAV